MAGLGTAPPPHEAKSGLRAIQPKSFGFSHSLMPVSLRNSPFLKWKLRAHRGKPATPFPSSPTSTMQLIALTSSVSAFSDAPLTVFRKADLRVSSNYGGRTPNYPFASGQNIFRDALMEYWDGCCPLTGIREPELLRASHIVPWAECESDELRLDVHNGLLLSALWDCAFDAGLISFADTGRYCASAGPQRGHQSCIAAAC